MSSKSNQTASEVQLKARRTSLGKKSKDELINIILRKDSTERKNNFKIQKLTNLLKEANSLNEEKADTIFELNKDFVSFNDRLAAKQDVIDSLKMNNSKLTNEVKQWSDKCMNNNRSIKNYKKALYVSLAMVVSLIVFLIYAVS